LQDKPWQTASKPYIHLISSFNTCVMDVSALIEKATSPSQVQIDQSVLFQIKNACKLSKDDAMLCTELLFDRIKAPNSQTRLLALEIIAELFVRSATVRAAVAARLPKLLELVIGFRKQAPLPPPSRAATCLRIRGLHLLERWEAKYGTYHRQLTVGLQFLKGKAQLRFPEDAAQRAAEEDTEQTREARAQEVLQEQYARLLGEWPVQSAECRSLLQQFSAAFEIVNAFRNPKQPLESQGDDIDWEDADEGQVQPAEGLATYAADPTELDATVRNKGKPCSPVAARQSLKDVAAPVHSDSIDPVLVENLTDVYRLIVSHALPMVQNLLRTILSVQGERNRGEGLVLLREATALRSDLIAAKTRYDTAQSEGILPKHGGENQTTTQLAEHSSIVDHADNARIVAPATVIRASSPPPLLNPYDYIRDPTAPRQPPPSALRISARQEVQNVSPRHRRASSPKLSQTTVRTESGNGLLPPELRRSLAARAPVLPAGPYVRVWDSAGSTPMYVSGHGMEVGNHWGPVDVHAELPEARMEELFLLPVNGRSDGRDAPPQQQQATAPSQANLRERQAMNTAPPRRGVSNTTEALGMTVLRRQQSSTAEGRRVQRAAERAYNDAVVSAAAIDAGLSHAVPGDDATMRGNSDCGSVPKRKAGKQLVKDRLRRKLLSGRAAFAVQQDAAFLENERRRDRMSNRWEKK
jgi:UV-stimulated scaffold protein A